MRRVVIAGGGVAGLEAILALNATAGDMVEITLVSPEEQFEYKPLSVAEPFGAQATRVPLKELARSAGARLRTGALGAVDTHRKVIALRDGGELDYDDLLVAVGGTPTTALRGALPFRGPGDVKALTLLLAEIEAGQTGSLAFVVPRGDTWALPAYELALMTRRDAALRGRPGVKVMILTPEQRPLELFGERASDATARLLDEVDIDFLGGHMVRSFEDGRLSVLPDGALLADRVVALPRLVGPGIAGLPCDKHGFIRVDDFARVEGAPDTYAAGDGTTIVPKQGGIAAQQADVAAAGIASTAGADIVVDPLRPVLRGVLLTGAVSEFMRRPLGGRGEVTPRSLWWPPGKIAGTYLSSFLALRGVGVPDGIVSAGVPVDVALGARLPANFS